jgi:DUF438 domain-containing protein
VAHGSIDFEHGSLSPQQLVAAFSAIPADITFVDAEDIVRYYSGYRIFSRTPAALDRSVLECHSEPTRPGVATLLGELRDGWREEAVFLAEKDGRPVHVRYLALRGADDAYLGCMEIAQWADEVATGA